MHRSRPAVPTRAAAHRCPSSGPHRRPNKPATSGSRPQQHEAGRLGARQSAMDARTPRMCADTAHVCERFVTSVLRTRTTSARRARAGSGRSHFADSRVGLMRYKRQRRADGSSAAAVGLAARRNGRPRPTAAAAPTRGTLPSRALRAPPPRQDPLRREPGARRRRRREGEKPLRASRPAKRREVHLASPGRAAGDLEGRARTRHPRQRFVERRRRRDRRPHGAGQLPPDPRAAVTAGRHPHDIDSANRASSTRPRASRSATTACATRGRSRRRASLRSSSPQLALRCEQQVDRTFAGERRLDAAGSARARIRRRRRHPAQSEPGDESGGHGTDALAVDLDEGAPRPRPLRLESR